MLSNVRCMRVDSLASRFGFGCGLQAMCYESLNYGMQQLSSISQAPEAFLNGPCNSTSGEHLQKGFLYCECSTFECKLCEEVQMSCEASAARKFTKRAGARHRGGKTSLGTFNQMKVSNESETSNRNLILMSYDDLYRQTVTSCRRSSEASNFI